MATRKSSSKRTSVAPATAPIERDAEKEQAFLRRRLFRIDEELRSLGGIAELSIGDDKTEDVAVLCKAICERSCTELDSILREMNARAAEAKEAALRG